MAGDAPIKENFTKGSTSPWYSGKGLLCQTSILTGNGAGHSKMASLMAFVSSLASLYCSLTVIEEDSKNGITVICEYKNGAWFGKQTWYRE